MASLTSSLIGVVSSSVSSSGSAGCVSSSFGMLIVSLSSVEEPPMYFSASGRDIVNVIAAITPKTAAINKSTAQRFAICALLIGCFTIFSLINFFFFGGSLPVPFISVINYLPSRLYNTHPYYTFLPSMMQALTAAQNKDW